MTAWPGSAVGERETPAPERESSAPAGRARLALVVFFAVLCAAFALRVRNVSQSMPYCQHPDENTWVSIAWSMLREGRANPRRFNYPSLPVYTMALGSSLGLVRARLHGDADSVKDFGKTPYPFYRVPAAAEVMRWLFTATSVGALAALGLVARKVSKSPALLYVAPLLGLLSSSYFLLSWRYMNVDTLGAFFVWLTTLHLVFWHARARASSERRILFDTAVAAALCGLAVGSKYNLGLLVLPCGISLLLLGRRRLLVRGLLFSAVLLLTFFLTTPFALFDHTRFLTHVSQEIRHYATGHPGHVRHKGLSAFLSYGQVLWDNWGPLLALAVIGLVQFARRHARMALLIFSFPVAFLAYMSMQRVVFERNIMSLQLFVALAVALGALELTRQAARLLRARSKFPQKLLQPVSLALAALVVILATPWSKVAFAYRGDVESRSTASRWIAEHVRPGADVLVDRRLAIDTGELKDKFHVVRFDSKRASRAKANVLKGKARDAVVVLAAEHLPTTQFHGNHVLARFGSTELHRGRSARLGDPRLAIVSFERKARR